MQEEEKNRVLPGVLYLVATPIGNLSDLSERARKVLAEVDFVAAEDTRNTGRLLSAFGIRQELVSYFEHNKRERGPQICQRLAAGESCALVTDAGTPAVSDPGEDLVRLCAAAGIAVTAVPGCCAAVNALALSALATGRFAFEGFLPRQNAPRRERLTELAREKRTVILYESPHHLLRTLQDLVAALGDRKVTLCREMTKRNEEIARTTLSAALAEYQTRDPRGEYVLVLAGTAEAATDLPQGAEIPEETAGEAAALCALPPEEHVAHYEAAGMRRMDAIKAAARDRGMSKSTLYALLQQSASEK